MTSVLIRVAYVGFLDFIFRFSYDYLGLLSYVVRLLGFMSLFIVPGLPYNVLKSIVKYILIICNIVLAWILTSALMTQGEEVKLSTTFIILKLTQICLVLTYYYMCDVNTMYRFLLCTYIFFIGGSVLQICPDWISNVLMVIAGYIAAILFLRINNLGMGIFSVEQVRQMILYIRGLNNIQSEDILKAMDRKEFIIYFTILLPITFTFNSLVVSSSTYNQFHPILISSLGMSCSTIISVKTLCTTVIYIFKRTVKLSYYLLKGENNLAPEQLLLVEYITTVYLFTSDLFIYNIESLERGMLLITRILLLIACLLEANFLVVEAVCSETDIIYGNLHTLFKVIGIHLCFSISSILMLYKLVTLYPMADLGIILTVAIFCCNIVRTLFSFIIFVLYKIDIIRQEFWVNFDDVVFYTGFAQSVVFILICVGTTCFAVWTLFFGVYMWIDLFRLLALCHVNIFSEIGILQNAIKQRRNIIQFTSALDEATDVEIRENADMCPICLQEMLKAKMTTCKHMFHEICLRKWLNIRLFCPLCKTDIAIH